MSGPAFAQAYALQARDRDTIIAALRFCQKHALSGRIPCRDEMEIDELIEKELNA
jgi:hypothetical protein